MFRNTGDGGFARDTTSAPPAFPGGCGGSARRSSSGGWIYLNLDTTVVTAGPNPPANPNFAQAWIEVVNEDPDVAAYGVRGRTVTVQPATQLSNAGD